MKTGKVRPKDIPGNMISNMNPAQIDIAARNASVHLAHLHAKQYEELFSGDKWCKSLEKKMKLIEPGVIFQAPVVEILGNRGIGIDQDCRASHANGSTINKIRTLIAIRTIGKDVEVVPTTGFSIYGKSPYTERHEYVRLAHQSTFTDPEGARGLPVVHYGGNNHLTKTTFFRTTRTMWISLDSVPVAKEGQIIAEDFHRAAALLHLPQEHEFSKKGNELRRTAELERRNKLREWNGGR